jgi:hypothetical protein
MLKKAFFIFDTGNSGIMALLGFFSKENKDNLNRVI